MKTAIWVPDETFQEVEGQIARLGMSRSEFYARAARRYLDHLDAEDVTGQIDYVLVSSGIDVSNAEAAAFGHRHLAGDGNW